MEPVEGVGRRNPLQAAKEPLSLRFLIAFSASTVLTAAVAIPMAFQAHLARQDRPPRIDRTDLAVLGTTTVPAAPVAVVPADSNGLIAATPDGEHRPLDGATLRGDFDILLVARDVSRVDFALDDEPVVTDLEPPWGAREDDAERAALAAGEHSLTATVRFDDGRVEVRRASFTVLAP